jgi:secreted PhoX family phosphatase
MGVFKHEAAAVDPVARRVYLTEDLMDGRLYRFTPRDWPKLGEGLLEAAIVARGGGVTWKSVPDPSAEGRPVRRQVPGATRFKRAEGIWFDDGTVYLATTGDSRIHAYDTERERIKVIYDGLASQEAPLLRVDQITASRAGELFVCEDLTADEIDMGVISRSGTVARFLSIGGREHERSELTGVTFDPSGSRMYLASQRAFQSGAVYEVSGPFKRHAA